MANEVHVRVNERGRHQPYRRVNGLYALDVGPAFVSPRDAITYAIELEGTPSVSPLRASPGGRPTGSSAPPVRMGAEVDRPPGAPRGSSAGPWGLVPIAVRRPSRKPLKG